MTQAPDRPSQFQIDEAYKQVKLNTRQKALDYVMDALRIAFGTMAQAGTPLPKQVVTAEGIIDDAKKIEAYLLDGIDAPMAVTKPTIVPAKEVPPAPRDYRK